MYGLDSCDQLYAPGRTFCGPTRSLPGDWTQDNIPPNQDTKAVTVYPHSIGIIMNEVVLGHIIKFRVFWLCGGFVKTGTGQTDGQEGGGSASPSLPCSRSSWWH